MTNLEFILALLGGSAWPVVIMVITVLVRRDLNRIVQARRQAQQQGRRALGRQLADIDRRHHLGPGHPRIDPCPGGCDGHPTPYADSDDPCVLCGGPAGRAQITRILANRRNP